MVDHSRPGKAKSTERRVALLLTLVAFGLRTFRLDEQALRGDEAASALYAALPVSELWNLSRVTDPHPPLYYLLLHPWQWLAGESAWAMRFAGVAASVLAVAALYALARHTLRVRSGAASLLAAALLALNPLQVWLAQDARSYPVFTLLGLLSSGALWWALHQGTNDQRRMTKALSSRPSSRFAVLRLEPTAWLAYILLTVASLYLHYYTVFLIAFQGLFVLANARRFWVKRWQWLASQVAIGLLIAPGLLLAYNFVDTAAGSNEIVALPALLRRTGTALLTGFTIDDGRGLIAALLLVPVALIGLAALLRRDFAAGSFWGLLWATPVLGVIALSINRPFFKERFLAQAQPAFEVLLAAGLLALANLRPKGPRLTGHGAGRKAAAGGQALPFLLPALPLVFLLYLNAVSLANYFTDETYAKGPPWQLFHDYVSAKAQPGDVVLTNFPEAAVSYYSPNELPFYVVPAEAGLPPESLVAQTAQIAGAYRRIWFLPLLRPGFDEQGAVLDWLDRHADRVDQVFFPVYNLNLYLSPAALEAAMVRQPVTFANGLQLRGYQIYDEKGNPRLAPGEAGEGRVLRLRPGEAFTLSLYWSAPEPAPEPYTVFTHLIAADGFNRAGQDNQPVWGAYPTDRWQPGEQITDKYTLTIPPGTPPGDHRLRVGWYHPATLQRVPVLDGRGRPADDHVILANLIVRVE